MKEMSRRLTKARLLHHTDELADEFRENDRNLLWATFEVPWLLSYTTSAAFVNLSVLVEIIIIML
jgi:hypothetical protein